MGADADPVPLDGNCLAGPLAGLLAVDVTTTAGRCTHCGDVAMLARAAVWAHPMGYVGRCRVCGQVLLVVVEHPDGVRVAARGLSWWGLGGGDDDGGPPS
ncbi:DUF6510 family protein [Isoptericola aurantiacus]|uniref:DUF6510 family protein n=1 Tax=Isoptericola aurantiacus TaxID=3377839 RepID=UPI00383B6083